MQQRSRVFGWRPARLWPDRRGVALIELAFVGPFALMAIVALLVFGYLFLAKQLVQSAVEVAARAMQTGNAQSLTVQSGSTAASTFVTNEICSALLLLPCNNTYVLVSVSAVPTGGSFFSLPAFTLPSTISQSSLNFCNGGAGQLLQINVVYMAPVIVSYFWPGAVVYNGQASIPLFASAAFADEKFPTISNMGTPC